jgi:hypothetical protein
MLPLCCATSHRMDGRTCTATTHLLRLCPFFRFIIRKMNGPFAATRMTHHPCTMTVNTEFKYEEFPRGPFPPVIRKFYMTVLPMLCSFEATFGAWASTSSLRVPHSIRTKMPDGGKARNASFLTTMSGGVLVGLRA